MNTINFTNEVWNRPENLKLKELVRKFKLNPYVPSDVFGEITDLIWDAGTCYPMFFVVIPHLIEIASRLKIDESKELWAYLGDWVSTHEKYREGITEDVLKCFDLSLQFAEKACIEQITSVEKLDDTDAQYLYASLFAFVKHRLGYMTMGGYMDAWEGTSVAECPRGHLNDVTVYNSGIAAYEEEEKPCNIKEVETMDIVLEKRKDNEWRRFEKRIQQEIDNKKTGKEVKSHLELSKYIIERGVDSQLPMRYAFSLYGSLLYCNGSIDAGIRVFHGLDEITCAECGEKFVFADGWCEDRWF